MHTLLKVVVTLGLLLAVRAVDAKDPVYAEGWYGFKNSSPQQRDVELINACAKAQGSFAEIRRVEVPATKGNTFDKLCESIGMRCETVCGWDGSPHACDEKPATKEGDGNRVAKCVPAKEL
ncbi:MAG: hypothetical protein AB7V27_16975 [Candidatus Binatia bacterium]